MFREETVGSEEDKRKVEICGMRVSGDVVASLVRFGYTPRESAFLYLVATYSGHFLPKQFAEFLGNSSPGRVDNFIRKAMRWGHLKRASFGRTSYRRYHLISSAVYESLGKGGSSHQRGSGMSVAGLKILSLEYVLTYRGEEFLEEETDKERFFVQELGIPAERLPIRIGDGFGAGKQRWFIDRYPIFVRRDGGRPTEVVFSYVRDETRSLKAFQSHLVRYAPLWTAMAVPFRLVFVSRSGKDINRARSLFGEMFAESFQLDPAIEDYFRIRRLWERREFAQMAPEDYGKRVEGLRKYRGPQYEVLYQDWKVLVECPEVLAERKAHSPAEKPRWKFEALVEDSRPRPRLEIPVFNLPGNLPPHSQPTPRSNVRDVNQLGELLGPSEDRDEDKSSGVKEAVLESELEEVPA